MFDDNYLEFAKFTDSPPLTRIQCEFATFLIHNHESVNKIGDLESIFVSVRNWLRTNPEMWVEHITKEESKSEQLLPAKFNSIEEAPFDWELSMTDIERKYKHKKPKDFDNVESLVNPMSVINYSKRNDVDYLMWPPKKQDTKCFCIGTISKNSIKQFEHGSEVYYNEKTDSYINYVKGVSMTFFPYQISKYIDYNGHMPNGKPKSAKVLEDKEFLQKYMEGSDKQSFHE